MGTWDPSKHPRRPAGTPQGGEFTAVGAAAFAAKNPELAKALLNERRGGLVGRQLVGTPHGFADMVASEFARSPAGQAHTKLVNATQAKLSALLNSQATYTPAQTASRARRNPAQGAKPGLDRPPSLRDVGLTAVGGARLISPRLARAMTPEQQRLAGIAKSPEAVKGAARLSNPGFAASMSDAQRRLAGLPPKRRK